jgi:LacI family transcriptional regulator, galactose operon repressor
MKDVAQAAGVSLKTVSRVVNGESGVGTATAERVTDAITRLGFRRNDLARSLRRAHPSATLGLVIEDLANPFYSTIARAVEEVARRRGYIVITASSEESGERERELVATLLSRQVDGLLLVPAACDHSYLRPELAMGVQVVFLDRPPGGLEADAVLIDNAGGARVGVEHLLSLGHRRIALIGDPPELWTLAERLRGYRAALAARGVEFDERLLRLGAHDVAQAELAARALLRLPDPPTAIFAANNRVSVGALRALKAAETRVALVGFDDFELADMLPVPVTVVRHDPAELGRRAAELLFGRLDGHRGAPRTVILPTELVLRGSGEVPP